LLFLQRFARPCRPALPLPLPPRKKWTADQVIAARERLTTRQSEPLARLASARLEPLAAPQSAAADVDFEVMCREASVRDGQLAVLVEHVRSIVPRGSFIEVRADMSDLLRIMKLVELPDRRDVLLAVWKHVLITPPSENLPSSTLARVDAICREFGFDGITDAVHVLQGGPL